MESILGRLGCDPEEVKQCKCKECKKKQCSVKRLKQFKEICVICQ